MAGRTHPEETRQEILTETLRLLSGSNYAAISTGMIAGACGITKPAIYYHFKSKEDLFIHLVGYLLSRIHAIIEDCSSRNHSVKEKLSDICGTLFGLAIENPHVVGGYLSMMADSSIREISREFKNSFEHVHVSIRNIMALGMETGEIKQKTDLDLASRMFHSTVLGLLEPLVLDSSISLPDPESLVNMLLGGIGAEENQ